MMFNAILFIKSTSDSSPEASYYDQPTADSSVDKASDAIQARIEFLNTLPKLPEGYASPIETVDDPFDLDNLRFREDTKTEKGVLD
ncbi:MAG: hypothetical protein O2904_03875 [bacterium]|nr:hypothetical protein [bacterium]